MSFCNLFIKKAVATILLVFITCQTNHHTVKGQGCFGGTQTFEKTMNFQMATDNADAQVLISQVTGAIILDCLNLCRAKNECDVINMDYSLNQCVSMKVKDVGKASLRLREKSAYFEKLCLAGVTNLNSICGERMWAFERVIGGILRGFVDKSERNVRTRGDCAKLCLLETSFSCLSAQYNSVDQTCNLSTQDRRSQKIAFSIDSERPSEYIENQCSIRSSTVCEYNTASGLAVPNIEFESGASSEEDCRSQCEHADIFFCRSYSYYPERHACSLSGDDSESSRARPISQPGSLYGERRCSSDPCLGGEVTFEKITGFTLRNSLPEVLLSTIGGNTSMCLEKCLKNGPSCPAVLIDYTSSTCYKLDRNSLGRNQDLTAVAHGGQSYFEKVCLSGGRFQPRCRERIWMFERVLRHELQGSSDKVLDHVQNRRECEDACLREPNFECRSASYDYSTTQCILSRNDRRTLPSSFVRSRREVDYLENQCVAAYNHCTLHHISSAIPRYVDSIQRDVSSDDKCRELCDACKSFTCRAVSYVTPASECLLSSEDRVSGGMFVITPSEGASYFERTCGFQSTSSTSTTSSTTGTTSLPSSLITSIPGSEITTTGLTTDSAGNLTSKPRPKGGRCSGNKGRTEYEKTTGYHMTEDLTALYSGGNLRGITAECAHKCDTDSECQAMVLDYSSNRCYARRTDPYVNRDILQRGKSIAYFEAVCYENAKGCGKLWTFERFLRTQLQVKSRSFFMGISRSRCEEKCLMETSFQCRSINYNVVNFECHLNSQDRVTDPSSILESSTIDYLENQCARGYTFSLSNTGNPNVQITFPSLSNNPNNSRGNILSDYPSDDDISPRHSSGSCDFTNQASSSYLKYVERAQATTGVSGCQAACSNEVQFTCRSYSFVNLGADAQCFLSADTQNSIGAEMETLTGAVYAERYCLPEAAPIRPHPIPTPHPIPIPPRPGPGPWPGPAPGIRPIPLPGPLSGLAPGEGPAPQPGIKQHLGPGPGRPNYLRPFPPYNFVAAPFQPPHGLIPFPEFFRKPQIQPSAFPNIQSAPRPAPPYNSFQFNQSPIIPAPTKAVCRSQYDYTYERITGLENADFGTDIPADLLTTPTFDCLGECHRAGDLCHSVTFRVYLDGVKSPCTGHRLATVSGETNMISNTQSAVFLKLCISGQKCNKPWLFERVLYHGIDGSDDLIIKDINNREDCASICLQQTAFRCRSLEYDYKFQECRLSKETRRSRPYAFRFLGEDVEYMENQCIPETTCGFLDFPNKFLPYFDRRLLGVPSILDCREACNQQSDLNCRSISFDDGTKECFLSSCDRYCGFTTVDRHFTVYAERLTCDEGTTYGPQTPMLGLKGDANIPRI